MIAAFGRLGDSMSASSFRALCCALILFVFTALPLAAQTSFGRISGTVTDPGGAVVTNAPVLVRNLDTTFSRTDNTNESGFYNATQLPIGRYAVSVEQSGFRKQERTDVQLS